MYGFPWWIVATSDLQPHLNSMGAVSIENSFNWGQYNCALVIIKLFEPKYFKSPAYSIGDAILSI